MARPLPAGDGRPGAARPGAGRPAGFSVRVKLTLSYAAFLMVAGGLLLAVVWVFLLRYVPDGPIETRGTFVPNRTDLVRAFRPAVLWALGFLLLFGLVGGWILAGRMLAPLERIAEAARLAAQGSLSHRVELAGPSDEFRELADVLDSMLARLEAQIEQQQRFAANASHELRTPLAITQTLLDVARDDPDRDVDDLLERLRVVNTRAIELTEALLLLSRADRRSFRRERVDLSLLAEEAAETLLPLAEKHGVAIEVIDPAAWPAESAGAARQIPPTTAAGSPALLLQMTINLLHNAIVHNLPDGGSVWIRAAAAPGWAAVIVENTGAPLPPAQVATLAEPFQRGAERVRGDHAGVGLGLAIVTSIVRAHDGALTLAARPDGGLRVSVQLPAA